MTFALLRRACVLLVPQRLTISLRVALLKNINRGEEQKYVRVGIKRGEYNGAWCLLMCLPERKKQQKVRKEWAAFID